MVIRRRGVFVGSAAWALPLIIADCDYNLALCTSSSLQLFAQLFHKRSAVEGVCALTATPPPPQVRGGRLRCDCRAVPQQLVGSRCWTMIYSTDFALSSKTSPLEKNFLTSSLLLLIRPQMERFRNPRDFSNVSIWRRAHRKYLQRATAAARVFRLLRAAS